MDLPEITKAQLQQCIETYRVLLSLMVQICTIFVVADATTVGYAVQQKFAGVLWVGIVFPMGMLIVMRVVVRLTIPILATAISIETKYKDPEVGGLISTFVAVAVSHHFLEQLRVASLLEAEPARIKAMAKIGKPYKFVGGWPVKPMLLVVMIGQAVAPVLLWHLAGWRLV